MEENTNIVLFCIDVLKDGDLSSFIKYLIDNNYDTTRSKPLIKYQRFYQTDRTIEDLLKDGYNFYKVIPITKDTRKILYRKNYYCPMTYCVPI